jgi:hypothetical protein
MTETRPWVRSAVPLLILLLAFGLRLARADDFRLWGDEGWSLYLDSLDLPRLTAETGQDIHPPLYHYLGHFWAQAAGWSAFASRYLSIWPGTLVVAMALALGRRLGGTRAAWTGAALLSLSPFALHYSQEIRPFMWATLWCTGALYVLLRLASASRPRAWAGYGLLSLLAAYTSYATAFWFAAHGAILLTRRAWRRRLPAWLGVEGVVVLLVLPWLLAFGGQTGAHLEGQGAFTGRETLPVTALTARTVAGLLAGVTLPQPVAWAIAGAVLIVAAIGLAMQRTPTPAAAAWGLMLLLPVLALYPVHLRFPWFEPRVLAFCVVPLWLFVAAGLEGWWARRRWAYGAALALVVGLSSVGVVHYLVRYDRYAPQVEDYMPLIAYVAGHAREGDVVLYNAPWHVGYFQAYYDGPPLRFVSVSSDEAVEQASSLPQQAWVLLRDIVREPNGERPVDQVEDRISGQTYKVGETWYGQIRLAQYVYPPQEEGTVQASELAWLVDAPPGAALRLRAYRVRLALDGGTFTIAPGHAIYLDLAWEAGQKIKRSYAITAQVIGPLNPRSGNPVWAQHDGVPVNQEYPTTGWQPGERVLDRHVMWLDPEAPPGQYALQVGVYDPGTGERLPVRGPDGSTADHAVLATLQVRAP